MYAFETRILGQVAVAVVLSMGLTAGAVGIASAATHPANTTSAKTAKTDAFRTCCVGSPTPQVWYTRVARLLRDPKVSLRVRCAIDAGHWATGERQNYVLFNRGNTSIRSRFRKFHRANSTAVGVTYAVHRIVGRVL
jgi:hypothetical protein